MRRVIGKGLSELIGEQVDERSNEVPITSIVPNTRQPREIFHDESLEELAASIREHGVLQPLVVRPISEGRYELIAGERRLRASKLAGLAHIPVVVRAASAQASLEIALIENIQREDISPLECAKAYRQLMSEFGLTQEQVADKVGKSRTGIANTIRLLKLPGAALDALQSGLITEGHARALLALDSPAKQLAVLDQIVEKGLTVRDVEALSKPQAIVRSHVRGPRIGTAEDAENQALEDALATHLGAPTKLRRSGKGGKVEITFFDDEDLQRILDTLGVSL
jgi:ParB family transcriptional regulator, chromosome partitioning protein